MISVAECLAGPITLFPQGTNSKADKRLDFGPWSEPAPGLTGNFRLRAALISNYVNPDREKNMASGDDTRTYSYNDYTIEVRATQDKSGAWTAWSRAKPGSVCFNWPLGYEGYTTREEAENKALSDAKAWIDENRPS